MYNPMFTSRFIHYMDSDEKKGKKEQEMIVLQEEVLEKLEEDIHEARVDFLNGCLYVELFRNVTITVA